MLKISILQRFQERLRFVLERQIQRGAGFQLVVIAATIGLVSLGGGLLAWQFTDKFDHLPTAVWWGFLRLTDPGYLGDDEGMVLRVVSTVLTVLGYVLFMGSLVAIMTQWLNRQIRQLEQGFTPVALDGHVVIIGWTARTPEIVSEITDGLGRLQRFLKREGARRLRIIILVEDFLPEMAADLAQRLGERWDSELVTFRTGSALKTDHLLRADPVNAAVIIVSGSDFAAGGRDRVDTRTIKTLLSLHHPAVVRGRADLPPIVAELFDSSLETVARQSCKFPVEVVVGDALLSRLIAQSCLHRGIWPILRQLLSRREGNSFLVRGWPELAGVVFVDLAPRFELSIPVGVLRRKDREWEAHLNPGEKLTLQADDLLLFVAASFDHCRPSADHEEARPALASESSLGLPTPDCETILILGWGRKVTALLRELGAQMRGQFSVTLVSRVSAEERRAALERTSIDSGRLNVDIRQADYASPTELEALRPWEFDRIVMMASDWLPTAEDADARTVLGFVLLRSLLEGRAQAPPVLVELMDPENSGLLGAETAEVIVSPMVISHFLSQVALRRELNVVFEELFGPGGAEFAFRDAKGYGIAGRSMAFPELQTIAAAHGEIVIGRAGTKTNDDGTSFVLNPDRAETRDWQDDDRLVVLLTHG